MVGMVVVSHSVKLAEGVRELALQMVPEVSIAAAGGTADGELGTDMNKIMQAVKDVYSKDGVIILFDIGSSYMNSEMALECLSDNMKSNVHIIDTALAEGAVVAAVNCSLGKNIKEIEAELQTMCLNKIAK